MCRKGRAAQKPSGNQNKHVNRKQAQYYERDYTLRVRLANEQRKLYVGTTTTIPATASEERLNKDFFNDNLPQAALPSPLRNHWFDGATDFNPSPLESLQIQRTTSEFTSCSGATFNDLPSAQAATPREAGAHLLTNPSDNGFHSPSTQRYPIEGDETFTWDTFVDFSSFEAATAGEAAPTGNSPVSFGSPPHHTKSEDQFTAASYAPFHGSPSDVDDNDPAFEFISFSPPRFVNNGDTINFSNAGPVNSQNTTSVNTSTQSVPENPSSYNPSLFDRESHYLTFGSASRDPTENPGDNFHLEAFARASPSPAPNLYASRNLNSVGSPNHFSAPPNYSSRNPPDSFLDLSPENLDFVFPSQSEIDELKNLLQIRDPPQHYVPGEYYPPAYFDRGSPDYPEVADLDASFVASPYQREDLQGLAREALEPPYYESEEGESEEDEAMSSSTTSGRTPLPAARTTRSATKTSTGTTTTGTSNSGSSNDTAMTGTGSGSGSSGPAAPVAVRNRRTTRAPRTPRAPRPATVTYPAPRHGRAAGAYNPTRQTTGWHYAKVRGNTPAGIGHKEYADEFNNANSALYKLFPKAQQLRECARGRGDGRVRDYAIQRLINKGKLAVNFVDNNI